VAESAQTPVIAAEKPAFAPSERLNLGNDVPMTAVALETILSVPEKSMTQQAPPSARPRKEVLRGILADIFEDLSGIDVAHTDASASFLDLGFDSLFLTQVT